MHFFQSFIIFSLCLITVSCSNSLEKVSSDGNTDKKNVISSTMPIGLPEDTHTFRAKLTYDYFKKVLEEIGEKTITKTINKPVAVFISYAWETETQLWIKNKLFKDLKRLGIKGLLDIHTLLPGNHINGFEKSISSSDFVIVIATPLYKEKYDSFVKNNIDSGVAREMSMINRILEKNDYKNRVIPLLYQGTYANSLPVTLKYLNSLNCLTNDDYYQSMFKLLKAVFTFNDSELKELIRTEKEFWRVKDSIMTVPQEDLSSYINYHLSKKKKRIQESKESVNRFIQEKYAHTPSAR